MADTVAPEPDRPADTAVDDAATVVVRDLHVHYRYGISQVCRLRALFTEQRTMTRRIHAVRGLSMVARRGEAIGLVGRNGAGKSTLLRAVAGLLPITSGSVHARWTPVRLGVNAALQPTLPARENIILGGLAMGLGRDEVVARVDDVIAFAGLRRVGERPLSTYSSGMRARIHFAIATAVHPRILLVDETLAVGDTAFRRRSRRRLRELVDDAGTVLVVSHNLGDLRRLCNRAVWIDQGRIVADGEVDRVLSRYRAFMTERE